ncbi:anhydro-N-acetylmuramic acid kinase [Amycolatopsis albispora]|uniref:Anhydro-N-acetylmuramic acid kinase n=1 Tax=Amycolatopsis albispora TaxID=1804986 RepID=A0A344L8B7_9PSEU|nr:anhydro-N-acetylmuramic acid kinase [Amycolatopsis albispora]AXB44291.1 anhydro-N-acetylmuramic acid kinase [Amycolatopsis albispora]
MTARSGGPLTVVGLISGTSIDGIDVAAARLCAEDGEVALTPLAETEIPYPEELRERLLGALPPNPCTAEELTRLDTLVGQSFAEAAATGVELAGGADLVASLGQTVFHWVEHGRARGTLQLGQPAWIAERTGLPVVADLRARDVAAGGHGAPLASTLDQLWLRGLAEDSGKPAVGLNIGGIANITVVRADTGALAYDTGPGNALLDLAAAEVTGGRQRSDLGGALAAAGRVHSGLLDRLLADPYYAAPPPKSTGKEHFHTDYLRTHTRDLTLSGEDLLATLTELTAATIAAECARHEAGTVVASGGGVENPALMRALAARLTAELRTSDDLGLPRAAKEAYLTALLGWLTWHGQPANLPSATGAAGPRLLGSITPGARHAALPPPLPAVITRLRIAPRGKTR